jgi:hypothetical protein
MLPSNATARTGGRLSRLGLLGAGLIAAMLATVWQSGACAAPISVISVSGAGNASRTVLSGETVAVGFTLGQDYTDVAIGAELFCVGCQGSIFLMRGLIGPTSGLVNFVAGEVFDVGSTVDPLLDGLDLVAGNYFLVLAITAGGAGWNGSDPPAIDAAAGSVAGLNFFADTLDTPAYTSDFAVILSSAGLHFTVTANDDSPIDLPAPPTAALMLAGLAAILLRSARKTVAIDRRA